MLVKPSTTPTSNRHRHFCRFGHQIKWCGHHFLCEMLQTSNFIDFARFYRHSNSRPRSARRPAAPALGAAAARPSQVIRSAQADEVRGSRRAGPRPERWQQAARRAGRAERAYRGSPCAGVAQQGGARGGAGEVRTATGRSRAAGLLRPGVHSGGGLGRNVIEVRGRR